MRSLLSLIGITILSLAIALPASAKDRVLMIRLQGATQAELDALDSRFIDASGDTMTGTLVLPTDGLVCGGYPVTECRFDFTMIDIEGFDYQIVLLEDHAFAYLSDIGFVRIRVHHGLDAGEPDRSVGRHHGVSAFGQIM